MNFVGNCFVRAGTPPILMIRSFFARPIQCRVWRPNGWRYRFAIRGSAQRL